MPSATAFEGSPVTTGVTAPEMTERSAGQPKAFLAPSGRVWQ
ncbi:MAG: hypothetical protein ACR2ME_00850 [Acidimicrobiia bacterium]